LAIYVLLVLRRVYRSYNGARFSAAGTTLALLFYAAIGLLLSILSFFEGVSLLFAPVYAAVLIVTAVWSYRYSDRRISFWHGSDGSIYFKGGVVLYLIYVAGFVARISIDLAVIGPNFFNFSTSLVLTSSELYATIATDLLLMFGIGLLIGRNLRILKRARLIKEGKEVLPDSPPPIQPIFGRRKDETPVQA
jgi:hypothetical protein